MCVKNKVLPIQGVKRLLFIMSNRPRVSRTPARFLAAVSISLLVALSAVALADEPIKPDEGPARGKEVLVIKESKDAQTFNAESQDVTVNGNHNRVTITGNCHALTISGDANAVQVAAVASIALSGTGNEVTWGKAVDGEKPQITDLGKANQVSHGTVIAK